MTPMNEAIGEYERQRPPKGWRKIIEGLLSRNAALWRALGLKRPRVAFLKGIEEKGIAVYIAGTMDYPVIGIDIARHLALAAEEDINPVTGVEMSIVHEAGHAYLETCGIDTFDQEEEAVEEFAREYADGSSPETAQAGLDAWVRKFEKDY